MFRFDLNRFIDPYRGRVQCPALPLPVILYYVGPGTVPAFVPQARVWSNWNGIMTFTDVVAVSS